MTSKLQDFISEAKQIGTKITQLRQERSQLKAKYSECTDELLRLQGEVRALLRMVEYEKAAESKSKP